MQVINDTRVNTFLNSIGRNSPNSRRSYYTALMHFTNFLKPRKQTPDTIIPLLTKRKVNVYEILDQFVSYLSDKVSKSTLKVYIADIRSYFQYYDVDISNSKFKRKVKMPRFYPDPEEPLTLADIRELLEYNGNHRLRTYLLLLTSSGMRAIEACSLRLSDLDLTRSPTRITVRPETTKTKRGRVIYCSDEASKHIQKLTEMHEINRPNDLIFSVNGSREPITIYNRILEQFEKLQQIADKDQRKENSRRHKITFHSFRRTCYSIISENVSSDFANWFLGHHHSSYWTYKESKRRNIYLTKCMPFLIIYQETRDNTIEASLKEKDKTIKLLANRIADIERNQKYVMDLMQDPVQLRKKLEQSAT